MYLNRRVFVMISRKSILESHPRPSLPKPVYVAQETGALEEFSVMYVCTVLLRDIHVGIFLSLVKPLRKHAYSNI